MVSAEKLRTTIHHITLVRLDFDLGVVPQMVRPRINTKILAAEPTNCDAISSVLLRGSVVVSIMEWPMPAIP